MPGRFENDELEHISMGSCVEEVADEGEGIRYLGDGAFDAVEGIDCGRKERTRGGHCTMRDYSGDSDGKHDFVDGYASGNGRERCRTMMQMGGVTFVARMLQDMAMEAEMYGRRRLLPELGRGDPLFNAVMQYYCTGSWRVTERGSRHGWHVQIFIKKHHVCGGWHVT